MNLHFKRLILSLQEQKILDSGRWMLDPTSLNDSFRLHP
jgi:hypothetical protein